MTEVTKKALALVDEVIDQAKRGAFPCRILPDADGLIVAEALCRAVEQHEAFKREVSEAVERAVDDCGHDGLRKAYIHDRLSRFILHKPDPLVEVCREIGLAPYRPDQLRAALAKHGLKLERIEHE